MSTTFAKLFRAAMVMLLVSLGGFCSTVSAAEIEWRFSKSRDLLGEDFDKPNCPRNKTSYIDRCYLESGIPF